MAWNGVGRPGTRTGASRSLQVTTRGWQRSPEGTRERGDEGHYERVAAVRTSLREATEESPQRRCRTAPVETLPTPTMMNQLILVAAPVSAPERALCARSSKLRNRVRGRGRDSGIRRRCDERSPLGQRHHQPFITKECDCAAGGLPSDPVVSDHRRFRGQRVSWFELALLDLFTELVRHLHVQRRGIESIDMHACDVRHMAYSLHMADVLDVLDKIDV